MFLSPVARLWTFPVLVVALTDPYSIESVVKQDKLLGTGYLDRKLGEPVFRNWLILIDGGKWRRHCKMVSAVIHMNILETFVENFAKNSDILANKLKALADGVTAHDIAPYLMRCSLDIIAQTSSRTDINAQNDNNDSTFNSITTIIDTTAIRSVKLKATELGKYIIRPLNIAMS
jgi:cytochrome P450